MPAWSIDATSLKGVPNDSTEWDALLADDSIIKALLSTPDSLWRFQESSGAFEDFIGAADSSFNSPNAYAQSISGWTRVGFTVLDNSGLAVTLPIGSAADVVILMYVAITSSGGNRTAFYSNGGKVNYDNAGPYYTLTGDSTNTTTGSTTYSTTVHPVLLKIDLTTGIKSLYTDLDFLECTFSNNDTSNFFIGGVVQTSPAMTVIYGAGWTGAKARAFNAFTAKRLLQKLGWTVSWSPWAKDATSGKGVPASKEQWRGVLAASGLDPANYPLHLWECQEASGNLADSIKGGGEGNVPLLTFNSPLYQQTQSGWSRKAVELNDAVDAFYTTAIGNTDSVSKAVLAYVALTSAPGSTQPFLQMSTGNAFRRVAATSAPVLDVGGTGETSAAGARDPGTAVHPMFHVVNRTGSKHFLATDNELLVPSYVAPSTGTNYLSFEGCSTARLLYKVYFDSTAAELSTSQAGAILSTLGWYPEWYVEPTSNSARSIGSVRSSPLGSKISAPVFVDAGAPAAPANVSTLVQMQNLVRAPSRVGQKQYIAQVERAPTLPAPTASPNELTVYPGKTIVARRHQLMRPSFFGPPQVIAGATVSPVGEAGEGTFAIEAEDGASVTYTWGTDIMKSLSGKEQRASYVYRPRQRYDFLTKLDAAKLRSTLSRFVGLAASAPVFLLGLSYEEMTIASGSSGTNIAVQPGAIAESDWAVSGQRVIVIGVDGSIGESYIMSAVGSTVTTFHDLSAVAKENARLMPAVQVYLDPNQPIGQHPRNLGEWGMAAVAIPRAFATGLVGRGATITTHDGLPVWDAGVGLQQIAQQPMLSGTELIDLGGTVGSIGAFSVPDWMRSVRLASDRRLDWQWLKKFFDTTNGGRKMFLLPTGRVDLVHVGDASSGTLNVYGPPTADAPDYVNDWFPSLAHRRIKIVLTTGAVHYRTVNSCLDNGDGTQGLVLASALAGAIDHVEFLEQVRLDGNELRVSWTAGTFATAFNARVIQR